MVEKSPDAARTTASNTTTTSGSPSTTNGPKPSFVFGDGSSTQSSITGLNLGFGIKENGQDLYLAPIKIGPYIVTLARTNPKAYSNIQRAVYGASGKNIKDPNTLASWVSRLAENIFYSTDPLVKTLSIEDFLRNTAKAANADAAAAALPQRQIYQYAEADRIKMIDDVSQTLRGQGVTEADKSAKWYKDLRKSIDNMIATGTVTTTSKVKNPLTGKLENKIVSTPGFSQEQVAATAEKAIRQATPEDVARKERVDFTSWMLGTLGGSNG
jgi:hypothetical protein